MEDLFWCGCSNDFTYDFVPFFGASILIFRFGNLGAFRIGGVFYLTSILLAWMTWPDKPLVLNCSTSPYTKIEVESGIQYWESFGYRFRYLIDNHPCEVYLENTITIDIPDVSNMLDDDAYGRTRLYYSPDNIVRAEIVISVTKERVLEHELGHALGLPDDDFRGSIMNRKWSMGGWDCRY